MQKTLLLTFAHVLLSVTLYAQSGAHAPLQPVMEVLFSRDSSRCLTVSYDDVALWDYRNKKPIWVKKTSELGGFKNLGFPHAVTADPTLTFMVKYNKTEQAPFKSLINLNTFVSVGWGWDDTAFTSDGRLAVVQPVTGQNKHILYLIDPATQQREKLYENFHRFYLSDANTLITIYKLDKKFKENPVTVYNIPEKKFVSVPAPKKSYYNDQLKRTVNKGEENLKYYRVNVGDWPDNNVNTSKITVTDQDEKRVNQFPLSHNPATRHTAKIVRLNSGNHTVHVLEYAYLDKYGTMTLSFINTYNYLTGQLVESFELTNAGTDALAVADQNLQKQRDAIAEQNRINNLPENKLKQRINMLAFNPYYLNLKTHWIYKVVTDRGPYENNLVAVEAVTSTGRSDAAEYIDNLENRSLYKPINNYQTCPVCQGKTVTQTYQEKEIDQTLSKGRKIVETTTNTKACGSCGGCGVIPK